jgi:hypothetical protein
MGLKAAVNLIGVVRRGLERELKEQEISKVQKYFSIQQVIVKGKR